MYDRVIDRVVDGVGDFLVEAYLYAPKTVVAILVSGWLALFLVLLWYLVLVPATANLVRNGSFEERLTGWGTGWLEDTPGFRQAARLTHYLVHNGAQAEWRETPDDHRPGGRFALLIQHSSQKQEHVWSTLSQRIPVRERATYEVSFWAKVDSMEGDGELWLSPGSSTAWDQPKITVSGVGEGWKRYHRPFNVGDRADIDIRFVTEAPMRVWIDDVIVRRVPSGETWLDWTKRVFGL